MDLQLTLAPALSKVMLLLTILVTFATVLGTNPPQGKLPGTTPPF